MPRINGLLCLVLRMSWKKRAWDSVEVLLYMYRGLAGVTSQVDIFRGGEISTDRLVSVSISCPASMCTEEVSDCMESRDCLVLINQPSS